MGYNNNTTSLTAGIYTCHIAGIPRRRHGHRHRLAKHGYNLTSDTRYFLARPRVWRVGVGVRVGVVECQLMESYMPTGRVDIFRLYPSQLTLVLDLATPTICKTELTDLLV